MANRVEWAWRDCPALWLIGDRRAVYAEDVTEFAFDPDKDAANLVKHGVGLAFGERVFDDPGHVVISSLRLIDGEHRYKAIGHVDGQLFTAVHVRRGQAIRLISVRRSNRGEQGDHDRDSR